MHPKIIFCRKNIITLSTLLIVDIVVIGSWTLYYQPDGSSAIVYLFVIFKVFWGNLLVAGILYFIKRYYTLFFVFNAFLSSFLLYLFFVQYIEISERIGMERWEFFIDGVEYTISCPTINKEGSRYSIEYSPEPGLSIGDSNDKGIAIIRNDTVYFTAPDSTVYFIYKNYLYNYKKTGKVKVRKTY